MTLQSESSNICIYINELQQTTHFHSRQLNRFFKQVIRVKIDWLKKATISSIVTFIIQWFLISIIPLSFPLTSYKMAVDRDR